MTRVCKDCTYVKLPGHYYDVNFITFCDLQKSDLLRSSYTVGDLKVSETSITREEQTRKEVKRSVT